MERLKIEYLPIEDLKEYPNNAKIHTPEQVEQIKWSIEQFGFNDPIAIWQDEIVEGHGRLAAAQELGFKELPVIRLDSLTDEERKAYALVHNKLTMNTGFDFELLNLELEAIDIDMEVYGFDINTEDYVDNFFDGGQDDPLERVGDYEEEHTLEVKTYTSGKFNALITYLKRIGIEYEEK